MTSTRTSGGALALDDYTMEDRHLILIPGAAGIVFLAVNRSADQRVEIILGAKELDELAAEILRLRDELDI